MKLRQLSGDSAVADVDVKGLSFDSRTLPSGFAFFAIRGTKADGHSHLRDVISKNPAALVVEDRARVPAEFSGPVIVVANARTALDQWAERFYGRPGEKLFCIGVTGTNGKTSSVYILESVFNAAGRPTGVIGTIDHHLGARVWETDLTTPDAVTLQSRLHDFVNAGAKVAAFEVTNVALDQDRASSVPYDAAIFTGFSRDHLDYHGTMEKYFAAKQKLFNEVLPASKKSDVFCVLNSDDAWIRKVQVGARVRPIWFGAESGDYRFRIARQTLSQSEFELKGSQRSFTFQVHTPGRHNVYNAVGAAVVALEAGVSGEVIGRALSQFTGAPGRLETVPNARGLHVYVDYAHTDDALRSVLTSLRKLMAESGSKGKLWTVFGCGGDRDKGKRPLMARAAVENSDRVVVTSDNPRTEDPEQIIRDCLVGIPRESVAAVETDRKLGIRFALQSASEGDVILIAGKGHENYQIVGQTKFPFSDVAVVQEILK